MTGTRDNLPQAQIVTVTRDEAGQRIDNFLMRHIKGVPKSRIYRILRKGEVRVNKGRVRAGHRVQAGDQVRIPPLRRPEPGTPARPPERVLSRLRRAVLHEDDSVLVLNKPAGLAVHGGSGLGFGVIEALRALYPEPSLELVHRLDRDTSGCLLVAKHRQALLDLQAQMRAGTIEKRYLALVEGPWSGGKRVVEAPLEKNVRRGGERVVRVAAHGRPAVTHFRPVGRYRGATLVEALLDTGRTHQIRVHAAEIGHPLAGDEKYGSDAFNRRMRALGLRRMFLHAHLLVFRRPGSEHTLHVSAPLDSALQRVLDRLEEME